MHNYEHVLFTLELIKPVVSGIYYDSISIEWEEYLTIEDVTEISYYWAHESNRLTAKMTGLIRYAQAHLTIDPIGKSLTR